MWRRHDAGLFCSTFDRPLILSYDGGGREGSFLLFEADRATGERSPGADMGRGERSPGADVAGASVELVQVRSSCSTTTTPSTRASTPARPPAACAHARVCAALRPCASRSRRLQHRVGMSHSQPCMVGGRAALVAREHCAPRRRVARGSCGGGPCLRMRSLPRAAARLHLGMNYMRLSESIPQFSHDASPGAAGRISALGGVAAGPTSCDATAAHAALA